MKANIFYKLIANAYDLLDVIYFKNFQRSPRKAVIEAVSENDKVLDLCTGTATNAMNISKTKPSTSIVGVDLSEKMLKAARDKIKKASVKNVDLYEMDATKLSFKSESFDKVLLSLILHETDEDLRSKILTEAKRVLKKDGRIIVTEWERSKKFSQRLLFMPIHLLEPKPYRSFVKEDLYFYFAKHGLQIEKYVRCDYTKVLVLKTIAGII